MSIINTIPFCSSCGSSNLAQIIDTIETIIDNKTLVIPNIRATKCLDCNEIHYSNITSKYIDKQISIFKAEGFENKSKEVSKSKGVTQEELGNRIGVTKQRINQIFKDDNLDAQTMIKIANAIQEPIHNVFQFRRISVKENKYYLE
ncbi:helix-turn-helix domain-containing protein [Paenibacillus sp. GCM10027627]|uniref:helix-turn-helix domain-containing protein n=1 Tax=unclassified Paenibacillus TaxID=185978 RepID=UPI0036401D54